MHNCSGLNNLISVGVTFDVVSGCGNNHKRTGSLMETRMAMLNIYLLFIFLYN